MKSLGIINFPLGGHPWSVHALGAIRRNDGDTNNQTIEVFLSPPPHLARTGYFFNAFAPIGLLPILRIGSVWNTGWHEPDQLALAGPELQVRLEPGLGAISQADSHADLFQRRWPMPDDIKKRGYFVETPGRCHLKGRWEDCNVLTPCPVIFGHFYAGTSNLATLLCRHPPPGKAWERIFYLEHQQTEGGTESRSWYDLDRQRVHVCLSTCIEDAGYRHVAWFYRERQARMEAKAIPNRLSIAPGDHWTGSHLQIGLPFTSEPELGCCGVWDEPTRTVLIHRVTRCEYRLSGTTTVTFDRENDARPIPRLPPGVRWEERSTRNPATPRKEAATTPPEGGKVSLDPSSGDQQSLTWQVSDSMEFVGFPGGKIKKTHLRTDSPSPTPPLTDTELHALLGCGEKAYTAQAKPGLNVQPPDPPSANEFLKSEELLSQVREEGFRFILAVLGMLLTKGWLVKPAVERNLIFDFKNDPEKPGGRRRSGKVLFVKLVQPTALFILAESVQDSTGKTSATIVLWPQHLASAQSPRFLLNLILEKSGIWKEIEPAMIAEGRKTVALKHQSLRPDKNHQLTQDERTYTFEQSVGHHTKKLLDHLMKRSDQVAGRRTDGR